MGSRARLLTAANALALASLLAVGGSPVGARDLGTVIDKERARGKYAVAVASGHAKRPHALFVKVVPHPKQRIEGAWTVVCSKGSGAGTEDGRTRGKGREVEKLDMPYHRPKSCDVAADAQLQEGGHKITVTLYARS